MAAESLENKAKEMGITLKAETNGSGGAKNVLTKEEIENCDGIIVAADKNVEMARFDGKQVLQTKVADGINKPEELIQSHDMAAQTLQYRYLLGGNLLIDMEEQHPVQEIAIEDDLAELKEAMKTGQKEQVYQILIKIEDSIRQALMEKSRACMYLQQVIRTMDNACEDVSADMDRIREDRDELLRQITDQKFFEDACKVVQKHTDSFFFMPFSLRFFSKNPLTIWFTHCRLQVEGLRVVNLGGEPMSDLKMGPVETRFAEIIWEKEPVGSTELVKLAEESLGWKKSTTYTVLKRLCDRGIFQNEGGTVTSRLSRADYDTAQSQQFVEESFSGSLPAFITAFTRRKKLTEDEIAELQKLIDQNRR